jgi:hypothetical protein
MVSLDAGLYAVRLLDWLHDEQAPLLQQRKQQRRAREQAAKRFLRDMDPHASDAEIDQSFLVQSVGIWEERDPEEGCIDVKAFLQPLGIPAHASYEIVSYLEARNWVKTSGRDIPEFFPGTLALLPGEEEAPEPLQNYDRVEITETGIAAVESNRLAWHEVMPQTAPLGQRLLVWLGNLEDPASTSAYLPNFLASGHGCFNGRPLFTAAMLQPTVKYLLTNGLLRNCADGSSSDGAEDVQLTGRGLECVVRFHGDVDDYLARVVNHGQRGDGHRAHVLTFNSVNERGWGWTASEIRRIQLLAWIAEQSARHPERYANIKAFYDARLGLGGNVFEMARSDLAFLAGVQFVMDGSGIGGIESKAAMLTPQGHDFLEQLQARRAQQVERRTACRDAMVAWLYAADAMDAMRRIDRDAMLQDPRHGMWLAVPFTANDLAEAAAWLHEHRLVDGLGADQAIGPLSLYLAAPGITCAEHYDSDTRRYLEEGMGRRSGPTVNIGSNHGPFQVAGDYAHQVQQVNASAEHLRELVTSITELVRLASPNVSDLDDQRTAALTAARDGAVDRSALKRREGRVGCTITSSYRGNQ